MRRMSRGALVALATAALLAALPAPAQISCAKLRWDAGADGAEAEIGCGSKHGVRIGMTGVLRAGQAGQAPIATFKVVREPDPETTWVAVTETYDSIDPFTDMTATFDQVLAAQLRSYSVLSVDLATHTAIVDAGCRQGVSDGLQGQIVRRLEDAGRVEVTTVATLGVVSTALETCRVAWVAAGPGHMPVAGSSEGIFIGLRTPSEHSSPVVASGSGGVDSRIVIPNEGHPVGTRLALVRRAPTGQGDFQYGEAVIERVAGDNATAVIVSPLLADVHVSSADAVVSYDSPACAGLPARHWNSEEFKQAQVSELNGRLATAMSTQGTSSDNAESALAEVRELRAMLEALEARTQNPAANAPTSAPSGPGSSVLHAASPENGDLVSDETVLTWTADEHCANRDLAVRIETLTDGGRRVEFQEQVGQGKHGKIKVGTMTDRIRSQMKKRELVQGFAWYVINMQAPSRKENCITEKRSVVLAVPIEKK